MRRLVRIEGDRTDLERAARLLHASEPRVIQLDGEFFLEATAIEHAVDATAARAYADALVPRLYGLLKTEFDPRRPFGAGAVVEVADDGTKHVYQFVHLQGIASLEAFGVATILGGTPSPAPVSPFEVGVRDLADPQVGLVADLLREDPSWVSLCKIVDAIEDDVGGGRTLEAKGWVAPNNLKRLTMTANAVEMAREGGRHAKRKSSLATAKLPPMTIEEAWQTVRMLARAWLLARR